MKIPPISLAVLVIYSGVPAGVMAQSSNPRDLRAGKFLVAARKFPDPTFAQTVILLTAYNEDGAMGLIINRQTTVPMARAVPSAKTSDPVYSGGPVSAPAVYGLLRSPSKPESATPVVGDVYMIAERALLEKTLSASPSAERFRAYLGYCGWGGGQLDHEVELGAWYIFAGRAEMVFDTEPESLWNRLVALTEKQIARTDPHTRMTPWPGANPRLLIESKYEGRIAP
ncbi:MAG TPA: YqgE/AlgH family protein [Bryobacteraceae bacterium]|nr:YqgE/AlgH family protein [Bryobacteraceae bacterium]